MLEIKVFDETSELLEYIAEQMLIFSLGEEPVHIALSGGRTPMALYDFIVRSSFKAEINWRNLHFWWGDERMVPESDADSNFGEAQRRLFEHVNIPEANLHPIIGSNLIGEEIARIEQQSQDLVPSYNDNLSFDWVLLGIGEDGHTASLFPDQVDYEEEARWVAAEHPESRQKRISLSAEALCNAQRISYLVTGQSKASIVDKVFADSDEADEYPAANIFAFEGETEWLLDADAASQLAHGH